jgi:hypothetical protein
MNPVITEIQKLIERHESNNPMFTGKIVYQVNYLNGKVESIQEYASKTVKMK